MSMRFEKDTQFTVSDVLPGREQEASAGLKALIDSINEIIGRRGFIDLWSREYLGGFHYGLDEEVAATLTDEERGLLFEVVPTKQMDVRQAAWKTMELLGVVRATVSFCGGNDEGHCDGITLDYGDGTNEALFEYPRPEGEKGKLLDLLTIPVYDRYGGFAGEFSVQGVLTWDYATKDVSMEGSEQVWEGFEEVV